jgi:hypothetical protein
MLLKVAPHGDHKMSPRYNSLSARPASQGHTAIRSIHCVHIKASPTSHSLSVCFPVGGETVLLSYEFPNSQPSRKGGSHSPQPGSQSLPYTLLRLGPLLSYQHSRAGKRQLKCRKKPRFIPPSSLTCSVGSLQGLPLSLNL